jgi:hypothetical protein
MRADDASPNFQQQYWYNPDTKETTWFHPVTKLPSVQLFLYCSPFCIQAGVRCLTPCSLSVSSRDPSNPVQGLLQTAYMLVALCREGE